MIGCRQVEAARLPNGFPLTACEPIEELPRLHEDPTLAPHYLPGQHPAMNEVRAEQ